MSISFMIVSIIVPAAYKALIGMIVCSTSGRGGSIHSNVIFYGWIAMKFHGPRG